MNARACGLIFAAASAFFGAQALLGRCFFWGDITYIHHPWRALAADMISRGLLPAWNPYAYLGMPLAAQMQGAAWYPGTLPFYLFQFPAALNLYYALHYGLCGFFAYLWLRRGGLGAASALTGAAVYSLNGFLVSRLQFVNHISTLAFIPALLLFSRSPWLLGLAASLAFLSGFPIMLAGGALAGLLLGRMLGRRWELGPWTGGALWAAGACSCLLLPALHLAAGSQRSAGLGPAETLAYGLSPKDLLGLIGPWLSGKSALVDWWESCWFGFSGVAAMALALPALKRRRLLGLSLFAAAVLALSMGGELPPSRWVWLHAAPLRYVRYPGNFLYLLLPAAAALAAFGVERARWRALMLAVVLAELSLYGMRSYAFAPSGYFADAGPLVRRLQASRGHRYLLSPLAAEWHRGRGGDATLAVFDLKHRVYGLSNLPFRLESVANFGEPLVPRANFEFMDFIYSRRSLAEVGALMPWSDAAVLMTRDRLPPGPLRYGGATLWHLYESPAASRAFWLSDAAGRAIPADLREGMALPVLEKARPLEFERAREDRFSVRGAGAEGWAYLAQPRAPGWRAWLGGAPQRPEPALGAFQKFRVPSGAWTLHFVYEPPGWRLGLLLTLLALSASVAYWYNRLLPS